MDTKDKGEEVCVLCCRETTIFAVGPCDHHVCYECSSRMRVLCQQNECPICRSDMPFVIFSHTKQLFSVSHKFQFFNKEYMIAFEDENIQKAFEKLLENKCRLCHTIFQSFAELERHVRREHSLFYCDVCANNLKLFTFERSCYDRKELAHHYRKGDINDKSHRGHPSCRFCEQRFMDHDELYRHLRKEHFFCHFCDADGNHQFYEDYDYLKDHFRKEHYLCEEEECAKEPFIGAFRSEIDFKAHKLKHTRNKSKAEVKQARTLDLEFTYTSRRQQNEESSPNQNDSRRGRNQNLHRRRNHEGSSSVRNNREETESAQAKSFNAQCVEDFPLLSDGIDGSSTSVLQNGPDSNRYSSCITSAVYSQRPVQRRNNTKQISADDFPALSSATSVPHQQYPSSGRSVPSYESRVSGQAIQPQNRQTFSQQLQQKTDAHSSKHKKNSSPSWAQKKKVLSMADFPQLANTERPNTRMKTLPPELPESSLTDMYPRDSDHDLGQQISKRCKEKSKSAPVPDVRSKPERKTTEDDEMDEMPPLTKMYAGLGKYSLTENQENKDPLKEKIEEIMYKTKANRFKTCYDEEIPWREPVKLAEDDFPPLESTDLKFPPGFSCPSKSSASIPPPGFCENPRQPCSGATMSLSSIAQQLNNLGQVKNVSSNADTKINLSHFSYREPVDFQERNNMLICKINELIGSSNKLFDEFKLLSGSFRKNKISAAEYHSDCLKILGKDKFLQLFPELLCLLPDIEKQQELLSVHERFMKEDSKTYGAVPKKRQQNAPLFSVCQTCSQVLAKRDFANHQTLHKNDINGLSR